MAKITEAECGNREAVVRCLIAAKTRPENARLYADSYIEYRHAQSNIDRLGAVVSDPRTGAAIPNPFTSVRDRAFARLMALHKAGVKAGDLW